MDKLKVLVADDEQIVRDLFERFLGAQGYSVSTAKDGIEALGKIQKYTYDVLLLDLKMPRMRGMELLRRVRQLKKDLIIIIVTGYATVDTAKEAIKEGCFDYITKPFDVEKVIILIKKAFEMRRLVREKKRLQEQVRGAEKLAALGQMGAGVAHEVNTVLTSVKLFLEICKPKLLREESGRNIDLILEEICRAEELIARFLKFAKPAETEFFKTDINRIVERSLEFLKQRLKKQNIKVLTELNREAPKVSCDSVKMEEVFLNVFSNSVDAMVKGGTLTVTSQSVGESMGIVISDTGSGVAPENLQKLYNPFFTTKAYGTGLGLSIVHRIIDEHNGTIAICSEKDKGTTVRIEVPIKRKQRLNRIL